MYCSNCDNFLKGDEYCEACYRALEAERAKACAKYAERELDILKAERERDEALEVLKECLPYVIAGKAYDRARAMLKRHGR